MKIRNGLHLVASACSVVMPGLGQEAAQETTQETPEHRQVRRLDDLSGELLRLEGDLTFHTTQEHYYADGEDNEDADAIEAAMRRWCLEAESGSFPTFLDGLAVMQQCTNGAKTLALFRTREVTRVGQRTVERSTLALPLAPGVVTHVFEGNLKVSFRTNRGRMNIVRDGKPARNSVSGPGHIFERATRYDDSVAWRHRMVWDAYADESGALDVLHARDPNGDERTLVFARDATFPFLVIDVSADRELAPDEVVSLDHAFVTITMYNVSGSSRSAREGSREVPYSDVLEFNYSVRSPGANIRRTIINRSRVFEADEDPQPPRLRVAMDDVRAIVSVRKFFGGQEADNLPIDAKQLPADVKELLDIRE